MSWMMEIGLSDTIAHLCWQGGERPRWWKGEGGGMGELWRRGECTSLPWEGQRQEDSEKTCNAFDVFSWLPRLRAHYPSKCGCCSPLSPMGPLADSPSCFLADSQSLPLTLCQANGWWPLWPVICFTRRGSGEGLFFSKSGWGVETAWPEASRSPSVAGRHWDGGPQLFRCKV